MVVLFARFRLSVRNNSGRRCRWNTLLLEEEHHSFTLPFKRVHKAEHIIVQGPPTRTSAVQNEIVLRNVLDTCIRTAIVSSLFNYCVRNRMLIYSNNALFPVVHHS